MPDDDYAFEAVDCAGTQTEGRKSVKDKVPQKKFVVGTAVYIACLALSGFLESVRTLPWWYQTCEGLAAAATLLLLAATHFLDPGIVPSSLHKDPIVEALKSNNTQSLTSREQYDKDGKGQWLRRFPNGRQEKFCSTCQIWRKHRTSHCKICGHCMERFDHHCDVVGTCIAAGNQRFFIALLCMGQLAAALLLYGCVWRLQTFASLGGNLWQRGETYLLLSLGFVYGWNCLALIFGWCHCIFLFCDVTTKQLATKGEPADLLCCGERAPAKLLQSWLHVCCGPVQLKPAPNEFRRLLDPPV